MTHASKGVLLDASFLKSHIILQHEPDGTSSQSVTLAQNIVFDDYLLGLWGIGTHRRLFKFPQYARQNSSAFGSLVEPHI